jgi:PAS domain S-box-containing protein
MEGKWKVLTGIICSFLIFGGALIALNLLQIKKLSEGTQMPVTLWFILILAALLFSTMIFINNGCSKVANDVALYKLQLVDTDNSLKEAQSEFNETVERRTFEISVINASLNREIAERIQAESEANKLQRRMELILESAGEGIFGLDTNGNVTFVNKAAVEMLGWSAAEMIGKSHHNMIHHTHKDGSSYPINDCPIHMAYKDGEVHFRENDVFWTKEKHNFYVKYVSTPILERDKLVGAVVVFSDITQRLEAEAERNRLQRQMELILESAGEGIFGLDTKGNVTFINKAASLMLGWSSEELVGKSHHDLVHHTHADGSPYPADKCPIFMTCNDGQVHFSSDDVFWSKEGSSFPVEYASTPIMEENVLTGAVIVFRDTNTFA